MNNRLFRNKIKTIFGLLILICAYTLGGFSTSALTLEEQKAAKQQQLAQLQEQIKDLKQQITQTQKLQASLKNEINLYNLEIRSTEIQIQATRTNMENTQLQIDETKKQIDVKNQQIAEQKKLMTKLIIQLNEYGNTSALQLGLGSNKFSDFMDQIQYTESLNEKIYSLLQEIKALKEKLEADQKQLEEFLDQLNVLNNQLQQHSTLLNQQKSSKTVLLQQTRGQESRYQTLLTQSNNAEAQINREIYELEQKLRGDKTFNKLKPIKGILAWPMDGVVTQKYGNTGFTKLGYNFHNGIDFAAPAGTPIYAAADGVVNATGAGQAAYGNWVSIRHSITAAGGHEIITLYAHMASFVVKKGDTVKRGDLVGYEGNSGNTTRLLYGPERGFHLHFTVFDSVGFAINKGAYSSQYGPYEVPYGYTYDPMDFF